MKKIKEVLIKHLNENKFIENETVYKRDVCDLDVIKEFCDDIINYLTNEDLTFYIDKFIKIDKKTYIYEFYDYCNKITMLNYLTNEDIFYHFDFIINYFKEKGLELYNGLNKFYSSPINIILENEGHYTTKNIKLLIKITLD